MSSIVLWAASSSVAPGPSQPPVVWRSSSPIESVPSGTPHVVADRKRYCVAARLSDLNTRMPPAMMLSQPRMVHARLAACACSPGAIASICRCGGGTLPSAPSLPSGGQLSRQVARVPSRSATKPHRASQDTSPGIVPPTNAPCAVHGRRYTSTYSAKRDAFLLHALFGFSGLGAGGGAGGNPTGTDTTSFEHNT